MPPKVTNKRLQEDVEAAPPAKRGRGRPPKDPDAPKRGRGRPRKDPNAAPPPENKPAVAGRGRGRPKKEGTPPAAPTATAAPKRGRGAPKKSDTPVAATPKTGSASKPGRGRPRKSDATANSKTGLTLTDIIGTYHVKCDAEEGNWPGAAEDMSLSIDALPNTKSTLIASFNLGILEGTMLLAADQDTLERVSRQMANDDDSKADKSAAPALYGGFVYFTWRGRNTGDDDEVHPDFDGTQTGTLRFKHDCSSFEGMGSFPAMGPECLFDGTRISDEAEMTPEPWGNFPEKAYEEANEARSG